MASLLVSINRLLSSCSCLASACLCCCCRRCLWRLIRMSAGRGTPGDVIMSLVSLLSTSPLSTSDLVLFLKVTSGCIAMSRGLKMQKKWWCIFILPIVDISCRRKSLTCRVWGDAGGSVRMRRQAVVTHTLHLTLHLGLTIIARWCQHYTQHQSFNQSFANYSINKFIDHPIITCTNVILPTLKYDFGIHCGTSMFKDSCIRAVSSRMLYSSRVRLNTRCE